MKRIGTKKPSIQCRLKFCEPCLADNFNTTFESVIKKPGADWVCPKCQEICWCKPCRRQPNQSRTLSASRPFGYNDPSSNRLNRGGIFDRHMISSFDRSKTRHSAPYWIDEINIDTCIYITSSLYIRVFVFLARPHNHSPSPTFIDYHQSYSSQQGTATHSNAFDVQYPYHNLT